MIICLVTYLALNQICKKQFIFLNGEYTWMSNENLPYEEDTRVYEIATCSEIYTEEIWIDERSFDLFKGTLMQIWKSPYMF